MDQLVLRVRDVYDEGRVIVVGHLSFTFALDWRGRLCSLRLARRFLCQRIERRWACLDCATALDYLILLLGGRLLGDVNIVPRTDTAIVRSSNLVSVAYGYLNVAVTADAHETALPIVALWVVCALLLDKMSTLAVLLLVHYFIPIIY